MLASTAVRPHPGIVFDTRSRMVEPVLPRMDVAGFVGFAANGPLNVPVPVEDPIRLRAIFGADVPLAWDHERQEQTYAQLGPAVRSFFANGGRRAYVVRVAASPSTAELPLHGVVWHVDGVRQQDALQPASLYARAPGSWAGDLRVGTALSSMPAALVDAEADASAFTIATGGATIAAGDLLRISRGGTELYVVAETVVPAQTPAGSGAAPEACTRIAARPGSALWTRRGDLPYGMDGRMRYRDATGRPVDAEVHVMLPTGSPPAPMPANPSPADEHGLLLEVAVDTATAPMLGTVVLVVGMSSEPGTLCLHVTAVRERTRDLIWVSGRPSWILHSTPKPRPSFDANTRVERLTIELFANQGDTERHVLSDLGLAPGHPRHVGELPDDAALFRRDDGEHRSTPGMRELADDPRFPLAAAEDARSRVFYPIGVGVVPNVETAPVWPPDRSAQLERDGLADFSDTLFLDPQLRATGVRALTAEANRIRWGDNNHRSLTGIHSLLNVGDATILAVPDAAHRHWRLGVRARPEPAPSDAPVLSPKDSDFADCAARVIPAPTLKIDSQRTDRQLMLQWSSVGVSDVSYQLQEATDASGWHGARTLHVGPEQRLELRGRGVGTCFYRVRALAGTDVSAWSNGVAAGDPAGPQYELEPENAYLPDVLIGVQRALLRLCAARGDALAVLSVPRHYRAGAAVDHATRLRSWVDTPTGASRERRVPALEIDEQRALGHGALYHPWLFVSSPAESIASQPVVPDGPAVGMIADRAATRGAWLGPANVPLSDVVALEHEPDSDELDVLRDECVNDVRQVPDGFVCLAQDTLSVAEDLRPINVGRLLALVRRLVLLIGPQYAFEPNDRVTRRAVRRGLVEVLTMLHQRGAFVGRNADEAFQVDVSNRVNTSQSLEQARLIGELRLAPSHPLTYLIVRLVHSADRGLILEAQ